MKERSIIWKFHINSIILHLFDKHAETIITERVADGTIHDLQGRRLKGVPQKGVYIQNGRKYVR
jgi:hypothetical protein